MELINKISQQVIDIIPKLNDVGLMDGKMGVAIYLFYASRMCNNQQYQEFADKMLDDVVENMQTQSLGCSFENGLAGIGWGIEHLMQNDFIEAADIFSAIDDRIFRCIVETENKPLSISDFAGYIHYLFSRMNGKISNPTTLRYHLQLVIELVNQLDKRLDAEKFIYEPLMFDITWKLPLVLLSLSKALELNCYDTKIRRIIEQHSPVILAMFPNLHAHRLYLLYAMEAIIRYIPMIRWKEHVSLLRQNISMPRILHEELHDKSIKVINGISGVALISSQLSKQNPENMLRFSLAELEQRIEKSEYWAKNNDDASISQGYAGLGLALLCNG